MWTGDALERARKLEHDAMVKAQEAIEWAERMEQEAIQRGQRANEWAQKQEQEANVRIQKANDRAEQKELEVNEMVRQYYDIQMDKAIRAFEANKKKKQDHDHLEKLAQELKARHGRSNPKPNNVLAPVQGHVVERATVGGDQLSQLIRNRIREADQQSHAKTMRTWVAISAGALYFIAWLILVAKPDGCHVSKFLWGRWWFGGLGFGVVIAFEAWFLNFLVDHRFQELLPDTVRIYPQILFVGFSLICCSVFTDRASIPPALFMSLHTIPVCLLLGVPDDFSFFDGFVGMAVAGIIVHYDKSVGGWALVFVYIGALLYFKLHVNKWLERRGLPAAINA